MKKYLFALSILAPLLACTVNTPTGTQSPNPAASASPVNTNPNPSPAATPVPGVPVTNTSDIPSKLKAMKDCVDALPDSNAKKQSISLAIQQAITVTNIYQGINNTIGIQTAYQSAVNVLQKADLANCIR